jgi:hypothetical protein
VSRQSMEPYTQASDREKREAVNLVAGLRGARS